MPSILADLYNSIISADTMRELHKQGGTKEDVISALQVLPVVRTLFLQLM